MGIIAVREGADELIRLRKPAGFDELFVGRVGVAPAQVLLYRTGKEQVLLQHDRDGRAQRFKVVLAHVPAADADGTLGRVIQAWDELHQCRLARTRAAEDADGHAGVDMQVYPGEGELLCLGGIFERDVLKINRAVLYLRDRVLR